jgi:hypothetical protein
LPRLKHSRLWQSETKAEGANLQDAALLGLLGVAGRERGSGGVLEHLSHAFVCLCRALEVFLGTQLLTDILSLDYVLGDWKMKRVGTSTRLLWGNGLLRGLVELLDRLLVVTQILLAANKDDGQALAEVQDFGNPLQKVSDKGARPNMRDSGHTFSWTLSSESGESIAKQIRIT